ncbi:MAG: xanthine dehydrogenase family protein molybdopterin-binding subunit [Minwuia sp.]|uniref:xanthine dehydrogenase family protein molybdopterin-binding subunit n=1 Tax=Minwuia sp. TaxID=2493630 RepID=UPI003A8AD939
MSLIGKGIFRREDHRFLTGTGLYTADLTLPEPLHAAFLRAQTAYGSIRRIDVSAATAVPGVAAILTGAEAEGDGLGVLPTGAPVTNRDGTPMREAPRPVLPSALVHHVGQPVAVVLAESHQAALEALDLIDVEIDDLPPAMGGVTSPEIHDGIPGNTAFDWEAGDFDAAAAAVDAAPHQVRIGYRQNRIAGAPIEGRVAAAEYVDGDTPSVTLHAACQGANMLQVVLGKAALRWPKGRLQVKVHDVGGGFGPKFFAYPEQAAIAWACWRLKRNVVWASERTESFISETHARDQTVEALLGLDEDGRFLAIAVSTDADMGAFLSSFAPGNPTDGLAKILTGLYDIPAGGLRARGYYSNTVSVDAYRGAGKPPGIYVLERLADMAADRLGMDRIEIRRRNLIPKERLPHTTPLGKVLDGGGDYLAALEHSAGVIDWDGAAARREEARGRGRLRGIGIACNLHPIGGSDAETSRVTIRADGRIEAWTGTQSTGQGHETVYAQILAERLQLPFESIDVRQGDTTRMSRGGGTGGSSSTAISGNTLARAADRVIEKARQRAAEHLETAAADIEYADGVFSVAGTDRRVSMPELAAEEPIEAEHDFADQVAAFPYGVVGAEVEIDPETGGMTLCRLVTCDDAGRIINPMLLGGQAQGALVQGAGQALMEHLVYDADGQVLAGSFMDYAMPRAADVPAVETHFIENLSPTNMLGIRGIGELGANGAPAAIANAVFDALKDLGVTELEPPFTAHRIWKAIRDAAK